MFLGHWQFFKGFFQFAFLRYLLFWFAVVPIFVKAMSTLPDQLKIPGTGNYLVMSLPFTWWLLWLASLAYFFAFILFHSFCPQFIKRYPSYSAYKAIGHSPRWVVWEFYYAVQPSQPSNAISKLWQKFYLWVSPITQQEKLFDRVITKRYAEETIDIVTRNPLVEQNQTTAYFNKDGTLFKISCNPDDKDIDVKEREIFWEVFGHFAKQGEGVRSLMMFLIGTTFLLLFVVLVQHIWTVAKLVF